MPGVTKEQQSEERKQKVGETAREIRELKTPERRARISSRTKSSELTSPLVLRQSSIVDDKELILIVASLSVEVWNTIQHFEQTNCTEQESCRLGVRDSINGAIEGTRA